MARTLSATLASIVLAGSFGCGRVAIENRLSVAIPAASLARLKAAAAHPDYPIRRIVFHVACHPADQAVAAVHYAETDQGNRVVRRCRLFANSNWPNRFVTSQEVAEYPRLLRPPSLDWTPMYDRVTETAWHRFVLGRARLEATLGDGVSRELAGEILEVVCRAAEAGHPWMRGHRPEEVERVEKWDRQELDCWAVWFRGSGFSSNGLVLSRKNGRLTITGIAKEVS